MVWKFTGDDPQQQKDGKYKRYRSEKEFNHADWEDQKPELQYTSPNRTHIMRLCFNATWKNNNSFVSLTSLSCFVIKEVLCYSKLYKCLFTMYFKWLYKEVLVEETKKNKKQFGLLII